MEGFAHTPKTRDAIVEARGEIASHFWRGVASLFGRR